MLKVRDKVAFLLMNVIKHKISIMKEVIPNADEFIRNNTHLTNEEMLKKFAKMHVKMALEETFKVSRLEAWEKNLIYECYPQIKIK